MNILIMIVVGAVFVVLCFGIYSLFRGGEYARNNSNKLMRLRVVLQFIAVCVIMLAIYLSGSGPG